MNRMRRLIYLAIALSTASSCNSDPARTRIVVVLDSDLPSGTVNQVRLETHDLDTGQRADAHTFVFGSRDAYAWDDGEINLPFAAAIHKKHDDRLLLVATGLKDGEAVIEQRAIAHFDPERTVYLPVFLSSSCRDTRCKRPDQSCYQGLVEGGCEPLKEIATTRADLRDASGRWPHVGQPDEVGGTAAPGFAPDSSQAMGNEADSGIGDSAATRGEPERCGPSRQECSPVLSGLAVSWGELVPSFSESVTRYKVDVGPWPRSLALTALAAPPYEIEVDGIPVGSGGSTSIPLKSGDNDISIAVTNGQATRTYYVTASRRKPEEFWLKGSDLTNVFGTSVAFSGNGGTLAIGSIGDKRCLDAWCSEFGAPGGAYVYRYEGQAWTQAYRVRPPDGVPNFAFAGHSLALDYAGNTLAMGVPQDMTCESQAVENDQEDSCVVPGSVYVYTPSSLGWVDPERVTGSTNEHMDAFGASVALSADGHTLAVGAPGDDRCAEEQLSADQCDDTGAVYVFDYTGAKWAETAYLKGTGTRAGRRFGTEVAFRDDGQWLAIGAPEGECSYETRAAGQCSESGSVYFFTRDGPNWSQSGRLESPIANAGVRFGGTFALDSDATALVVGAAKDDGCESDLPSAPEDNGCPGAGAVFTFVRTNDKWALTGYLKASNAGQGDLFGAAVGLSRDSRTLVVGSPAESSCSRGLGGDQADNACDGAGASYVFTFDDGRWAQREYLKPSNLDMGDAFGTAVGVGSRDGLVAIGARAEAGCGTPVVNGPGQDRNDCVASGAVYVYR